MKIINNKISALVPINEIKVGETFYCDNELYIKIEKGIVDMIVGGQYFVLVLNLLNYSLDLLSESTRVERVNSHIIID